MAKSNKKVILGVTASISLYKAVLLLRLIVKFGYEVHVVMTKSAKDFVSPLTFSVLSKHKVIQDFHHLDEWENHIKMAEQSDLFIVYPATCSTLAKLANGIADNILVSMYLSATCPIIIAPAMDGNMWQSKSNQRNVEMLKQDSCHVLDVEYGELASGITGLGRLMEPEKVFEIIIQKIQS